MGSITPAKVEAVKGSHELHQGANVTPAGPVPHEVPSPQEEAPLFTEEAFREVLRGNDGRLLGDWPSGQPGLKTVQISEASAAGHFWAEGYQTHHPGEMQQLREQGFERVALGGGRSIFLTANDAQAYRDFRAAAGRESPEGETPDQTTGIPHSTPGQDLNNLVGGQGRSDK